MNRTLIIFGGAAIAIAVAYGIGIFGSDSHIPVTLNKSAMQSNIKHEQRDVVVTSLVEVQSLPIRPIAPSTVNELAVELERAKDYRVLFESLLSSNSAGSGLYADHILKVCTRVRSMMLDKPSESTRQDAARAFMVARCSTFSDDELSAQRRINLIKDPRLKRDLDDLRKEVISAGLDPEKLRTSLRNIIDKNDPLLLEQVLPSVFYIHSSTSFKFAGTTYSSEYGQLIINAALAAACVSSGIPCADTDQYVVESCAMTALCASSRAELVALQSKKFFGEEGEKIFKTIYPEMLSALKNNDVEQFLK